MKRPEFQLNMALTVEVNILRLRRWINRIARRDRLEIRAGERRKRGSYAANTRRYETNKLFPFNAYRNPRRGTRR